MEADACASPWSKICISHADCILLVGSSSSCHEVRHCQRLQCRLLHVCILSRCLMRLCWQLKLYEKSLQ